jgi:hypothetical protein
MSPDLRASEPPTTAGADRSINQLSEWADLGRVVWSGRSLVLLGLIAVVLGAIAWNMLPPGADPITPVPPLIGVITKDSNIPVTGIDYEVTGTGLNHHVVLQFTGAVSPRASNPSREFTTTGVTPVDSSPPLTGPHAGVGIYTLRFDNSGKASISFDVKNQAFGYSSDRVRAAVAVPGVYYIAAGAGPILNTKVDLPSAPRYDWSSFPPTQLFEGIEWVETPVGGDISSRTAVGVNHGEQSKDDRDTFIAGALIGLAGAALIAAIQEALHMPVRRGRTGSDSPTPRGTS